MVPVGTLDNDAAQVVTGVAFFGDQRFALAFGQVLGVNRGLENVSLRNALRPRWRKHCTLLLREGQTDLCTTARRDTDIGKPFALVACANALHTIGAGGQVLRIETPLLARDNHEGQTTFSVLEFYNRTGNGLARSIGHTAIDGAPVSRQYRLRSEHNGARRNSCSQTLHAVSKCH